MAAFSLASVELSRASGYLSSNFSKVGQQQSRPLLSFQLRTRKFAAGCFDKQLPPRRSRFHVCADYGDRRGGSGAGEFVAGFVLGGLLFGALGCLFAPQVTSHLFGTKEDGDSESTISISDDDEGIAKTRRNLNEKIAKLNAAIDNVSAQLRADNGFTYSDDNVTELESAA